MQEKKRSSCCCKETAGSMQPVANNTSYRDYQDFPIKWTLAGVSVEAIPHIQASSSKVLALLAVFFNVLIGLLSTQRK